MSCIDVSIRRVGKGIVSCVTRIGEGLEVTASNLCEPIKVVVDSLSSGLRVTCGLVCTTNKDAYLFVNPNVVWLTPDMLTGEFDILSNVVWKID